MNDGTTTLDALRELRDYFRQNPEETHARLRFSFDDPVIGGLLAAACGAGISITARPGIVANVASMSDDQLVQLSIHARSTHLEADIRRMLRSKGMRLKDGKTIVELVVEAVGMYKPSKHRLSQQFQFAFQVTQLLRQCLHPDAVPDLVDGLNEKDPYVRWCVACALGFLGPGSAVPALVGALADKDDDVRQCARASLLRICTGQPSDSARDTLLSALKDPHPFVRASAIRAVAGLTFPGVMELVPTFIAALADSDKDVRESASAALGRITGKSFLFGSADPGKWQKWWDANKVKLLNTTPR